MGRNWSALAFVSSNLKQNLAMAFRLGRDLPPFLQRRLTLEQARTQVRHRLSTREQRFLSSIDRLVYGVARSPYRHLLAHAGCERGDLHALVAREGLEGALSILAGQGVYVTFDEWKGRRIAERGSARFAFAQHDFDNPYQRPHLHTYTGGTGGPPTPVLRTLASVEEGASILAVVLDAYGIKRPRNLFLFGGSAIFQVIHMKLGHPLDAWFLPTESLPAPMMAYHRYLKLLAARGGCHFPLPERHDPPESVAIARWLVEHRHPGTPMLVNGRTSVAVRVATAARAMGASLDHVTFHCRSEPFSAARRRTIVESGAQTLPDYASVELPHLSYGCPTATTPDDMHLSSDRYAVVEHQRACTDGGPLVDALLFTTLSDRAPKVALNIELGDSARVEQRDCDCALGTIGLRTHLSEIRSFEKLSAEGTTFSRGAMLRIIEEVLPARFGGTAIDYQLVEEEAATGASLLVLRVDPAVGSFDEAACREVVLDELGRGNLVDAYQAELLRRAASVVVRRLPPLATTGGKVLPLHLLRSTTT